MYRFFYQLKYELNNEIIIDKKSLIKRVEQQDNYQLVLKMKSDYRILQ